MIEGDLVGGNMEDLAVIRMILAMRVSGEDPKKIKRLAREKGVALAK